tara:strand:- start:15706 stop:23154 length:7449 start_codon:yes stop_codon:yes gene_type:complete
MASNLTVFLSGAPTDSTVIFGPYTIKGETEVTFDFDGVNEGTFSSIKLVGDFGDDDKLNRDYKIIRTYSDTDETLEIAETGKISNVLRDIPHIYEPSEDAYFTQLTAQFDVTFSNLRTVTFYTKFNIAQDSLHTAIDRLHLVDTQISPLSTNTVFAIFHNQRGEIINEVLVPQEADVVEAAATTPEEVSAYPLTGVPASLSATHWWAAFDATQLLQTDGASATDTDSVSAWIDRITGTYNMTQSGVAQPTFRTGIRNTQPAVLFDGVDDSIAVPDSLIAYSQPYSVLVVMHDLTGTKAGAETPYYDMADTITAVRSTGRRISTNQYNLNAGTNLTMPLSTTAPTANDAHIFVYIVNGTDSSFYVDGVSAQGDAGTNSFRPMQIGSNYLDTTFLSGFMFEIAFWDRAITNNEVTTLNNHYSSAFDIGLSAQPTPEDYETESFPLSGVPQTLSATHWWNAQKLGNNDLKGNGAIAEDGNAVMMWRDRITGTYNLTDPDVTTNQRPDWQSNTRNSQGAVRFEDANDTLTRSTSGDIEYAQPYSVVFTFQDLSGAAAATFFDSASAPNVIFGKSGGQFLVDAGTSVAIPTSGAPVNTDPHIVTIEFNGGSSKVYFDSVTAAGGRDFGSNGIVPLVLGAASNSMSANVFEVQFYDKILTTAELNTINAELSSTFLINLSAQPTPPPLPALGPFPLSGIPTHTLSATHWYSALYQDNLLANAGEAVSDQGFAGQWYDRITGTYNLTQTGTSQPMWDSTARLAAGGTVFDGVDDSLTIPLTGITQYTQPYTVVITFQDLSSLDTNYATIFDSASTGVAGSVEFYKQNGSYFLDAGTTLALPVSTAPVNTAPHIAIFEMNGSSTKVYFDSVTAISDGVAGANAFDFLRVGNNMSETSAFSGSVFDIQFYNEILTETKLNTLHSYLSSTWNINLSAQPIEPTLESFPMSGVPTDISATHWYTARYSSSDIRNESGTNATSGQEVTFWRDRITGTYNLTHESALTGRPQFIDDVRGTAGAVLFDGADTLTRTLTGLEGLLTPVTIIITFQDLSASSKTEASIFAGVSSTFNFFSKSSQQYTYTGADGSPNIIPVSSAPVNTAPHIFAFELNGTDGAKVMVDSVTAWTTPSLAIEPFRTIMFGGSETTQDNLSGFIYDFQVYDKILTLAEYNTVYADLSSTYLINLSAQPVVAEESFPLSGVPTDLSADHWWNASYASYDTRNTSGGIAASGADIAMWRDRITGTYNLTDAASARRPQFIADVRNEQGSMLFDGDDTLTRIVSGLNDYQQPFSIVFTYQDLSGGSEATMFDTASTSEVSFTKSGGSYIVNAGTAITIPVSTAPVNTDPHIAIIEFNGAAGKMYFDSVTAISDGNFGSNPSGIIEIGAAATALTGHVFDVQFYDKILTTSDLNTIHNSLSSTYLINLSAQPAEPTPPGTAAPGLSGVFDNYSPTDSDVHSFVARVTADGGDVIHRKMLDDFVITAKAQDTWWNKLVQWTMPYAVKLSGANDELVVRMYDIINESDYVAPSAAGYHPNVDDSTAPDFRLIGAQGLPEVETDPGKGKFLFRTVKELDNGTGITSAVFTTALTGINAVLNTPLCASDADDGTTYWLQHGVLASDDGNQTWRIIHGYSSVSIVGENVSIGYNANTTTFRSIGITSAKMEYAAGETLLQTVIFTGNGDRSVFGKNDSLSAGDLQSFGSAATDDTSPNKVSTESPNTTKPNMMGGFHTKGNYSTGSSPLSAYHYNYGHSQRTKWSGTWVFGEDASGVDITADEYDQFLTTLNGTYSGIWPGEASYKPFQTGIEDNYNPVDPDVYTFVKRVTADGGEVIHRKTLDDLVLSAKGGSNSWWEKTAAMYTPFAFKLSGFGDGEGGVSSVRLMRLYDMIGTADLTPPSGTDSTHPNLVVSGTEAIWVSGYSGDIPAFRFNPDDADSPYYQIAEMGLNNKPTWNNSENAYFTNIWSPSATRFSNYNDFVHMHYGLTDASDSDPDNSLQMYHNSPILHNRDQVTIGHLSAGLNLDKGTGEWNFAWRTGQVGMITSRFSVSGAQFYNNQRRAECTLMSVNSLSSNQDCSPAILGYSGPDAIAFGGRAERGTDASVSLSAKYVQKFISDPFHWMGCTLLGRASGGQDATEDEYNQFITNMNDALSGIYEGGDPVTDDHVGMFIDRVEEDGGQVVHKMTLNNLVLSGKSGSNPWWSKCTHLATTYAIKLSGTYAAKIYELTHACDMEPFGLRLSDNADGVSNWYENVHGQNPALLCRTGVPDEGVYFIRPDRNVCNSRVDQVTNMSTWVDATSGFSSTMWTPMSASATNTAYTFLWWYGSNNNAYAMSQQFSSSALSNELYFLSIKRAGTVHAHGSTTMSWAAGTTHMMYEHWTPNGINSELGRDFTPFTPDVFNSGATLTEDSSPNTMITSPQSVGWGTIITGTSTSFQLSAHSFIEAVTRPFFWYALTMLGRDPSGIDITRAEWDQYSTNLYEATSGIWDTVRAPYVP